MQEWFAAAAGGTALLTIKRCSSRHLFLYKTILESKSMNKIVAVKRLKLCGLPDTEFSKVIEKLGKMIRDFIKHFLLSQAVFSANLLSSREQAQRSLALDRSEIPLNSFLSHEIANEKELKDIEKEMRKIVDEAIAQAKEIVRCQILLNYLPMYM